jgi:hypothetical protein
MTPKEKAEELVDKFIPHTDSDWDKLDLENSKQCAIVAVDEIERAIDFDWMEVQNLEQQHRYWQQVRQEILKL